MIGMLVFFLVIVVALMAFAGRATARMAREQRDRVDAIRELCDVDDASGRVVLHYRVPAGQDPAVVTLGLDRAGFEAVEDPLGARPLEVLIADRDGMEADREKVRTVLAGITQLNFEGDEVPAGGPIRFTDEAGE
jgi:hypothetical protein